MGTQRERAVIDLVINGEQSRAQLKEITAAAVNARKELSAMAETDPGYAKKEAELKALLTAQKARTVSVREEISAWQKFKTEASTAMTGVVMGNIATAGIQALISFIPDAIDRSIKLKDQLADVAKAADMTDEEVKGLRSTLKDIPTRVPLDDLMKMAEVGGQFGVAKKELVGFTDGMNQVNVAIGSAFGNVENLTDKIMPLRNIFAGIKTDNIETDILHIGNALNVLEAQGAATSPVMADLSSRIGGVMIPLGLSEGAVLGYSATLQELNVTAERGGTGIVAIFQRMLTETETFAKVAGKPLKEYKDLINTDINQALMLYLEGLKKVSGSQTEFAAVLQKSKLTGASEMEVLSKMVSNMDMLKEKTNTATEALTSVDSITAEYNKKNFELAVNMKKLSAFFGGMLSGLSGLGEGIVNVMVKILGLSDAQNKLTTKHNEQRSAVNSLAKSVEPLIKRHDELSKNSKRSTAESDELKKITLQIAQVMPGAATQFDKYGNAIGVSTSKARDLLEVQRELLKTMNKGAIAEQMQSLTQLGKRQNELADQRKTGKVKVVSSYTGEVAYRTLTQSELSTIDGEIKQRQQQVQEVANTIRDLEGNSTSSRRSARRERMGENDKPKADVKKPSIVGIDLGETPDEKAARKAEEAAKRKRAREEKATEKHEDRLETLIMNARERVAKNERDEFEYEQLQFGEHYAELFKMADGHSDKMAEISELMYKELNSIEKREADRKEKKLLEEDKKKEQEAEADNKTGFDAAMREAEQNRLASYEPIENESASGLISDADAQLQQLQADALYLNQKLLLEQTFAQDSARTQEELTANWNRQGALRAQSEKQYADAMRQAEYQLQDAKRSALNAGVELLMGILKKNTVAYKAALVAQKAYAVAQIIVDTQREIAGYYANPTWSLEPDGGLTIKTVNATAAKIRAGIAIASIAATTIGELAPAGSALSNQEAPKTDVEKAENSIKQSEIRKEVKQDLAKKADGGYTGVEDLYGSPSGFYTRATRVNAGRRSYIMGEAGKEWIMGGKMLADPVMANLAGALQAMQVTGNYRQFSQAISQPQPAPVADSGITDQLLMQILQAHTTQQELLARIGNRPISFDVFAFERKINEINSIRTNSGLRSGD